MEKHMFQDRVGHGAREVPVTRAVVVSPESGGNQNSCRVRQNPGSAGKGGWGGGGMSYSAYLELHTLGQQLLQLGLAGHRGRGSGHQ